MDKIQNFFRIHDLSGAERIRFPEYGNPGRSPDKEKKK
jgi:hypothetical protein